MIGAPSGRGVFGALLAGLALLVACSSPQGAQLPAGGAAPSQAGASITANPNPVPPGSGPGTTTIVWKTGDGSQGQVYVSQDGAAERLFDAGTDGSTDAPWIQTGSTYDFRIYAGTDHKTQLAAVKVTRAT